MDGTSILATPLGTARCGFRGRIVAIRPERAALGLAPEELERRLIELGFVEGETVEILHEGPLGHDPIAVAVKGALIGLRRREAMAVLVQPGS
jgi:ferrous iron transport protein A